MSEGHGTHKYQAAAYLLALEHLWYHLDTPSPPDHDQRSPFRFLKLLATLTASPIQLGDSIQFCRRSSPFTLLNVNSGLPSHPYLKKSPHNPHSLFTTIRHLYYPFSTHFHTLQLRTSFYILSPAFTLLLLGLPILLKNLRPRRSPLPHCLRYSAHTKVYRQKQTGYESSHIDLHSFLFHKTTWFNSSY
jgi:hypothetical protein